MGLPSVFSIYSLYQKLCSHTGGPREHELKDHQRNCSLALLSHRQPYGQVRPKAATTEESGPIEVLEITPGSYQCRVCARETGLPQGQRYGYAVRNGARDGGAAVLLLQGGLSDGRAVAGR